jgi:hypothetical protein
MAETHPRTPTWVELRVHGVSGTPPEDLLDRPHVRQVDGDDRSRFFRAVDADSRILSGADSHTIEGFHWGRYTSGSWKQSFWLAMLPFGLVNLAAFMLPAPAVDAEGSERPGPARLRIVALGVLRLLGVLMTMLLSLAISLTLVEVVCVRWLATQHWTPDWLATWSAPVATVAAGLVLAVLGGTSWFARLLGRRSRAAGLGQSLHMTPSPKTGTSDPVHGQPDGSHVTPFATADFYQGDAETMTLRGLHVAAGLAVPAFLALSLSGSSLRLVALTMLGLVTAVVTLLGDRERAATTGLTAAARASVLAWHRTAAVLTRVAVLFSIILLGIGARSVRGLAVQEVVHALEGKDRYVSVAGARTRAFDLGSEYLLYSSAAAMVVLALVVVLLAARARPAGPEGSPSWYFRPYTRGWAAVPVAGMGLFLGVGYSAALVTGTSSVLNRHSDQKGRLSGTTDMLDRVAYSWALALLPLVGIGVVLLVQRARSARQLTDRARLVYPEPDRDDPRPVPWPPARVGPWRRALAGAIWFARVKNGVAVMVWVLAGFGSLLAAGIILEIGFGWNVGLLSGSGRGSFHDRLLIQIGTWVLLALIAGLVALARGAFKDANLRRAVNIVWDVVAFWPHAVHPFIPTPYSVRAVGDLAQRVRDHLGATEGVVGERQVVVCGHSQGSLVGFAALNLLDRAECDRVALLTFGSQLRVIFPRAFPLYVSFAAIERLHGRLGGAWVNLYRDTDPLAGPVLSWNHTLKDGVGSSQSFPDPGAAASADEVTEPLGTARCGDDWRLVDPVPRVDPTQAAPVDRLHGHSDYWANPDWPVALDEVRRR